MESLITAGKASDYLSAESKDTSTLLSREANVIGGGLIDGLGKAGTTTLADLSHAGHAFLDSPLAATGTYLKNHWQEAVVGAGLSALAPKRWMNVALVGYCMRGFFASTVQAGMQAADGAADIGQLRNSYSDAVSHEGTAFISSLPMTMAGGMVGRAGANAVFGKNLGAMDLLSGKVSPTEVKANLWDLHDSVLPPATKLVVSDMDGTLSKFWKYEAIGVQKAITDLSAKTGLPEKTLYDTIGHEMEIARSHDYPWVVELALQDKMGVGKPGGMTAQQFRTQISEPFWNTIDQSMKANLDLFDGVADTLHELRNRNIPVVVLSDAPAFIGLKRLTQVNLDRGLVERMYALHNWQEPGHLTPEMLALGRERVNSLLNIPHGLKEFRVIPKEWEKPHTDGFNALIGEYGLRPKQVLMIGDSRVKDVGVAARAGSRGLWAEYGNPPPEYEEILLRLRPLPEKSGAPGAGPTKTYPPMVGKVDNYAQLLDYLHPRADYLSLSKQFGQSLLVAPRWQATLGYNPWFKAQDSNEH